MSAALAVGLTPSTSYRVCPRRAISARARCLPIGGPQVAQELVFGRQHEPAFFVDRVPVRLHRPQEAVELPIAIVRTGVDRDRLRIGLAHHLLRLAIRFGFDLLELPLFLAADFGALALALGPVPIGNSLALRDHSLEYLGLYGLDIVDASNLDILELDAVIRHRLGRALENEARELFPPQLDLARGFALHDILDFFGLFECTVVAPHHFDEVMV